MSNKREKATLNLIPEKRAEVLNRYNEIKSWRAVGKLYPGISYATLREFALGATPGEKTCHALGLPLLIPVPVCDCGEVHTLKNCPVRARNHRIKTWDTLADLSSSDLTLMLTYRTDLTTMLELDNAVAQHILDDVDLTEVFAKAGRN